MINAIAANTETAIPAMGPLARWLELDFETDGSALLEVGDDEGWVDVWKDDVEVFVAVEDIRREVESEVEPEVELELSELPSVLPVGVDSNSCWDVVWLVGGVTPAVFWVDLLVHRIVSRGKIKDV